MSMFKYKSLFYSLILLICICIFILTVNEDDLKTTGEIEWKQMDPFEGVQENDEWEMLNHIFVIRRYGAFYDVDQSLLHIIVLTEHNFATSAEIIVKETSLESGTVKLRKIPKKNCEVQTLFGSQNYTSFLMSTNYTFSHIDTHFSNINIQIKLIDTVKNLETRNAIDVLIKSKTHNVGLKETVNKESIICSKWFNYSLNYFENMKWWIEINKHLGYKKLVLFNASIPFKKYNALFEKHKDFVEVRPYELFPHIIDGKFKYVHKKDITYVVDKRLHERVSIVECFYTYFADYDRIAVFDSDEIIFPIFEENKAPISAVSNSISIKKAQCSMNIDTFFDNLKPQHSRSYFTYYFEYFAAIENEFMKVIISQLEAKMKNQASFSTKFSITNYYKPSKRYISFQVFTPYHFNYAKQLIKIFNLYKNHSSYKEYKGFQFNRIFMIHHGYRNLLKYGKSVHELEKLTVIDHHRIVNRKLEMNIAINHAGISHFRPNLVLPSYTMRIDQIKVDLNFLNCIIMKMDKILS